jgi:hypothetical protein
MRAYPIAVLVAGLMVSASVVTPGMAWAQGSPPRPSAGELETAAIGKVATATGLVTIEHANAVVVQANLPAGSGGPAKIGDPVFRGDVVQTGADGKLGITFTDGTAFNLSSNARMVLNEFVYDPNGTANSTLFSLTKGTFTFIAGKVAKTGDMKIDTPVATMGIRGTTPHVEISADGTVRFANLIEENKAQVTEKVEQNKRGTPGKQHRAAQPSSGQRAESKTFDLNFKLCRGC